MGPLLLLILGIVWPACKVSAAPPAYSCGKLTDYYGNTATECAPDSCNAKQQNLAGDVIVLDSSSYGRTQCQGCSKPIPSTCCQQCKDTDGCNAWTYCSLPGGCGTGCLGYIKQFKGPVDPDARLPHKMFGNFNGCNSDKWPFAMCSLKFIKDPKNAQTTSTKASDGWVSGIISAAAADPKCPATLSAKSCKACLATKNPAKCFDCLSTVNKLFDLDKCTLCANLTTPAARDACIACAASPDDAVCGACDWADRSSDAFPTPPPVLASVDACYACQAKTTGGNLKPGAPIPAKAAACGSCYIASVPKDKRANCLACVASSVEAVASGCAQCYAPDLDTTRCLGCLKTAKTEADGNGCASCTRSVPATFVDACVDCVFKAGSPAAKPYCSNLRSEATKESVQMMYKCLATAKDSDRASACWQCFQNDPAGADVKTNAKCYDCMNQVSSSFGIYCSHCWSANRVQQKKSDTCQNCVLNQMKAKGDGFKCI